LGKCFENILANVPSAQVGKKIGFLMCGSSKLFLMNLDDELNTCCCKTFWQMFRPPRYGENILIFGDFFCSTGFFSWVKFCLLPIFRREKEEGREKGGKGKGGNFKFRFRFYFSRVHFSPRKFGKCTKNLRSFPEI
jgi:hypothetical protein